MICRADTLGVFQIESRAQMSMLPRLKPRTFYDLVIEVAIVRPGPIQGDMVHPYLRRRQGKEKAEYPKPELEEILEQDAGCAAVPGTGDEDRHRRRRLHAGRGRRTAPRHGHLQAHRHDRQLSPADDRRHGLARATRRDFAERCFKQIEGFGEYGFPESHAASFALLVYASCWFKTFYPDVFCAAILNSQPMGFYQPAQLVRDARDHGVDIRDVDVNFSVWDCTLEKCALRSGPHPRRAMPRCAVSSRPIMPSGLASARSRGFPRSAWRLFVERRGDGYESVRDVWLRSGLDVDEIERLAQADAFRSLGLDRREALWAVRALDGKSAAEKLPLFDQPAIRLRELEPETKLPKMPLGEHVIHDYRSLGLSLKAHPVAFLRERLDRAGVTPNAHLASVRDGRRVSVAGLVLVRQRPGKGNAIFLTLEDDKAVANVIFWERTFNRYRPIVMGARFVRVTGKLQSESDVIHIVAEKIEDLTPWLTVLLEKVSRVAGTPTLGRMQSDPARQIATLSGEGRKGHAQGAQFSVAYARLRPIRPSSSTGGRTPSRSEDLRSVQVATPISIPRRE